jgi:hypothetical protein
MVSSRFLAASCNFDVHCYIRDTWLLHPKREHVSFINCCEASGFLPFLAVIVVFFSSNASLPLLLFKFHSSFLVHKAESPCTHLAMLLKHSASRRNNALQHWGAVAARTPRHGVLVHVFPGLVRPRDSQVPLPRQPLHLPWTINWWRSPLHREQLQSIVLSYELTRFHWEPLNSPHTTRYTLTDVKAVVITFVKISL